MPQKSKDGPETDVLLVEGADDFHFFNNLMAFPDLPDLKGRFRRDEAGGIEEIKKILPLMLRPGSILRLGIVVDADDNMTSQWQSIRQILTNEGYKNTPDVPNVEGTIIYDTDKPVSRIGIWLMPNNQITGTLENFVQFLVPQDSRLLLERALQCVQQIPIGERLFGQVDFDKAHIHTWLAWQAQPGTPLGQAITKRYLDINLPEAQRLIAWLRRLFVEE